MRRATRTVVTWFGILGLLLILSILTLSVYTAYAHDIQVDHST